MRGFQMNTLLKFACIAGMALAAEALLANERLTDGQIRDLIIQESLSNYSGNCPCPYNVDRAGRRCGGRSAWNRAGAHSPICYAREISDEQVRSFRKKHRVEKS